MSLVSFLVDAGDEPRRNDAYPFRRVDFACPYLAVCALLAGGEILGFAAADASACWPVALAALVVVAMAGFGWEIHRWPWVAVLLSGFCLALYAESRRARVFDQCDYSSSPLSGEFRVEGRIKVTKRYLSFDSSLEGVEIRVMIRRVIPEVSASSSGDALGTVPSVGEVWRCDGWLERKPRGERRRRMLWVCGSGSAAARVSAASSSSLNARLRRLRAALSANVGYGLSHDPLAANLDRAIVLGERADLPREILQMFADAGTVHVFAISGLHIGVIAWIFVYLLMAVFCFPLRWVAIPLTPILCGYVMMIGAPPSAVRAAFMSIVYFSAPIVFRRSDSLVAWSITFVVFHVLNPAMLMKVGSLLSFTVMLGILLYIRWAQTFKSERLIVWGVTFAAWISGVGIAARVFERISLGGFAANVVMIPLASLSVVLGFLGAITGFVSPWLASHFNNGAALLIEAMRGVSWAASAVPYANLMIRPWALWMCAGWYVAFGMTLWLVRSVYLRRRICI